MMNDGWMGGWGSSGGGGMWIWTTIGVLVLVMLAIIVGKMSGRKP